MTQFEMTETLSRKMNVTLEEAKTALEAADWNMVDAAVLIEQARAAQAAENAENAESVGSEAETAGTCCSGSTRGHMGAKGFFRTLGHELRKLIACGNRNHLVVRRNGETMMEVPVTAMALLLVFAFWVTVPLMVIGLFAGCHYSFNGSDLGRDDVNNAMEKASETAERVKAAVMSE